MLPDKYKASESESRWQKFWADEGIYRFDHQSDREIYSVDTPPPTVSGVLHIGHVYSYTQAEIIARYQRMMGKNVFYPFGFDDNGLPTERYVEKTCKVSGKHMKRSEFNELCKTTVCELEERFRKMWVSLGFSADWSLGYATIDETCQRISQKSFLDLYAKGLIEHRDEPNMWCPECQTAIAQAELENEEKESTFNDIRFTLEDNSEIIIATTRPELLPSCVCIFVHPEDERYIHLHGKMATVPIFLQQVPVLTDEKADQNKGTGAVMCCTFGDKTDIEWFKKHRLPLRVSITPYGKMTELAKEFAGMKIKDARKAIIERLSQSGELLSSKSISHPVNTHERCGTDVEYLSTRQWIIKIMEHKQDLLQIADKINWYPAFMKQRYIHWVENLNWDWCISRQRFFGVPFPVWHCEDCKKHILATEEMLPVDPVETAWTKPCPHCGGHNIIADTNIMDTWATSSVTPQINCLWKEEDSREKKLAPLSLRPQAHDIIRTWAFYTIVKAWFHQNDVPWKDIMISGHVLYKKGQKISKSKSNSKSEPEQLIEQYSADVIRYWTAGAKLGSDCYLEEQEFKIASKLVTKLFNASRFALTHLQDFQTPDAAQISFPIDKGLMSLLSGMAKKVNEYLKQYEYSLALSEIETFFWDFCDNYMELVKHRLYQPQEHGEGAKESGQNTIYHTVFALIRLLAPFVPHITEEIYQAYFREICGPKSVHLCTYPQAHASLQNEEAEKIYKEASVFVGAVRKFKTEKRISLNTDLNRIDFQTRTFPLVPNAMNDVKKASRCENIHDVSSLEGGEACEFEGKTISIHYTPAS